MRLWARWGEAPMLFFSTYYDQRTLKHPRRLAFQRAVLMVRMRVQPGWVARIE